MSLEVNSQVLRAFLPALLPGASWIFAFLLVLSLSKSGKRTLWIPPVFFVCTALALYYVVMTSNSPF